MVGTVISALLLAASISVTTYNVPQKRIPTEIVRHGNELWFVAWTIGAAPPMDSMDRPKLQAYFGRVTARGRFRIEPAPADHMPGLFTHAPDGTLWLSDASQPALWRISPKGRIEKVTAIRPTQTIAFGPDGNLWTTHASSSWIGRYGQDGSDKGGFQVPDVLPPPMTSIPPPPPAPRPSSIVLGPDGAMWFTETYRKRIGRVTMAGEMTMFAVPHAMPDYSPIIAGPDGALWYLTGDRFLGRITTSGEISKVPIGLPASDLAADSRGRIWYAVANAVGVLERDGTTHEHEVSPTAQIHSIAEGPDGAMWFSDNIACTIGRIELPDARPAPRTR